MPSHLQNAITENRLGHFAAALAHAEAAIRLRQEGVKPYLSAAFSAARLHGEECALQWVERGLALAPDDCLALAAHANLLLGQHHAEAALDSARRWAELQAHNGEAHWCCARAYHELQLFDAAIAAYGKAAQFTARPAAVLTDLSILLFELGQREAASKALDRALAADATHAAAWYTRAEAKRFARADPDIEAMRQLLAHAAQPHSLHDKILLHYALAKAHADFDDYAQALNHLRTGSALKRATLNYDARLDERFMAEMARAFTAASLERLRGAGIPTKRPLFIVGMPRSGTSLLEQVLASHPRVLGGGESARIQSLVTELGAVSGVDAGYPACLDSLSREQVGAMAKRYLDTLPARPADHSIDKTPYNFLHLGVIHAMFPQARIIHCMRDPVDACVSVYSKWFAQGNEFSYDLDELARYYLAYAKLMQHWRGIIPESSILEVRYEKLVEDFAGETRRVTQFCGLPWSDASLTFHATQRAVRTASMHQVREPLYRSSIGRARHFPGLSETLREKLDRGGA